MQGIQSSQSGKWRNANRQHGKQGAKNKQELGEKPKEIRPHQIKHLSTLHHLPSTPSAAASSISLYSQPEVQ
jgi:hypothetical protein